MRGAEYTLEDYLLELRIPLFNLLKPGVLKKSGLESPLGMQQRRDMSSLEERWPVPDGQN
jgi:hypothetical protein